MIQRWHKATAALVLAPLALWLDRLVKLISLSAPVQSPVSFFGVGRSLNEAGPLSLPLPGAVLVALGLISLLAVLWLFISAVRHSSPSTLIGAALILAGGLSNIIDRVALGGVVDVFWLRGWGVLWFNLADIYLVIGLGLLLAGFSRGSLAKRAPGV